MIAIIDYGVGNLFSLSSSFSAVGAEVTVTSDPNVIASAQRIVLPGVGAFSDAAQKLRDSGMDRIIYQEVSTGKPLLGICLGMQLLFEKSYEYGEHDGLGLIPGRVCPIKNVIPANLKIPHIGWNPLHLKTPKDPLFSYVNEGDCVYFVHSFYATDCEPYVIATAEYGAELTAAVRNDHVWGAQFHPEKSGAVGLAMLKAFCEL